MPIHKTLSTVLLLSQNCHASKPIFAEFEKLLQGYLFPLFFEEALPNLYS